MATNTQCICDLATHLHRTIHEYEEAGGQEPTNKRLYRAISNIEKVKLGQRLDLVRRKIDLINAEVTYDIFHAATAIIGLQNNTARVREIAKLKEGKKYELQPNLCTTVHTSYLWQTPQPTYNLYPSSIITQVLPCRSYYANPTLRKTNFWGQYPPIKEKGDPITNFTIHPWQPTHHRFLTQAAYDGGYNIYLAVDPSLGIITLPCYLLRETYDQIRKHLHCLNDRGKRGNETATNSGDEISSTYGTISPGSSKRTHISTYCTGAAIPTQVQNPNRTPYGGDLAITVRNKFGLMTSEPTPKSVWEVIATEMRYQREQMFFDTKTNIIILPGYFTQNEFSRMRLLSKSLNQVIKDNEPSSYEDINNLRMYDEDCANRIIYKQNPLNYLYWHSHFADNASDFTQKRQKPMVKKHFDPNMTKAYWKVITMNQKERKTRQAKRSLYEEFKHDQKVPEKANEILQIDLTTSENEERNAHNPHTESQNTRTLRRRDKPEAEIKQYPQTSTEQSTTQYPYNQTQSEEQTYQETQEYQYHWERTNQYQYPQMQETHQRSQEEEQWTNYQQQHYSEWQNQGHQHYTEWQYQTHQHYSAWQYQNPQHYNGWQNQHYQQHHVQQPQWEYYNQQQQRIEEEQHHQYQQMHQNQTNIEEANTGANLQYL